MGIVLVFAKKKIVAFVCLKRKTHARQRVTRFSAESCSPYDVCTGVSPHLLRSELQVDLCSSRSLLLKKYEKGDDEKR